MPTFECETCIWLHIRDTFEALIVQNTTLSNVEKFHYLIASLKNGANDLISNLQITHENFIVAWQLVTQRYNNKRLIAMIRAKHLCQLPPVKRGDVPSLRQLINHISSHMNALQALSLNVPIQDLDTLSNSGQLHKSLTPLPNTRGAAVVGDVCYFVSRV